MLRALYTAGTAMLTQTRRMDVITNNMANVETRGFKTDTMVTRSFRDMLIERISDPSVYRHTPVGPHNTGIHVDQSYTWFMQGGVEQTHLGTDIALVGDGFFTVETPNGERYTRAGDFNIDAAGNLVTPRGEFVLGRNGRITLTGTDPATGARLPLDQAGFLVTEEGDVYYFGELVDRLRLVQFPQNADLRKQGDNLYFNYDPEGNPPAAADGLLVKQGFLENSNVDIARETVTMIEVQRNYESNQRMVRMLDESLGRAVNDIERV